MPGKDPISQLPGIFASHSLKSHLQLHVNSNDVYHGQKRNREMEAGPECEGAMRLQNKLLAPRK